MKCVARLILLFMNCAFVASRFKTWRISEISWESWCNGCPYKRWLYLC